MKLISTVLLSAKISSLVVLPSVFLVNKCVFSKQCSEFIDFPPWGGTGQFASCKIHPAMVPGEISPKRREIYELTALFTKNTLVN